MGENDKIVKTVEAIESIVKAVPIYNDAIQPGAKQIGEIIETLAKTIKVALLPLTAIVWGYDRIGDFLQQKLTQKLANIPPDRIKTPSFIVAGPIVEALRFASEEETLRELYANLLATSIDSETARNAHPGFVQIIKSLSPDEAKILKFLTTVAAQPLINVLAEKGSSHNVEFRNFSHIGIHSSCDYKELTPNYLDNLSRLGLIEIEAGKYIVDPDENTGKMIESKVYKKLEEDIQLDEIKHRIANMNDGHVVGFEKKVLSLTDLGKQFCIACVIDKNLQKED